ncbi:hypothetical protein IMSHALPRED_003786 [Imshaugia aleurites]|uniref:Uncharacterized protein n=1 Tax=Imshaugia aleurites TaxID=172621 RepID=A0A8H3I7M8_9LECA|nr:hypothetical protein IMSHALPRED_003786 [Imshaugia aleurites]
MADPIHPDTLAEDQRVSAQDLHRLLVQRTEHDTGVASELLMRLGSLFGKDAPRDHFTASSVSSKTSSLTDVNSLGQETESTMWSSFGPKYLHRERTDSEKAVKGAEDESQIDGRVMFQEATVIELARHIPNDSSDELNRRGEEAEAIIDGTGRAFSGYFGSHFDKEVSNDLGLWPLAASNGEEAKAVVEGLVRAHEAIQITL